MRYRRLFLLALFFISLFLSFQQQESGSSVIEDFYTGLIPATPEQLRGVPLAYIPYSSDELPSAVDLSKDMPPVGNQGKQNSCVAWAVAYVLKSYQEKIEAGQPYIQDGRVDLNRVFSPSFIYNQLNNGRDGGIHNIDALRFLSSSGAAPWSDMPYNESDFRSQPSNTVRTKAQFYRIVDWRQVNVQDTRELKAHLNAGYPIIVGVGVDRAFRSLPKGQIWRSVESITSYHDMVIVGYNDQLNAFKMINSWGHQWADNGFCWTDYGHFHRVVLEGFVAKDAINGPGPSPQPPPQPVPQPQPTTSAGLTITEVKHNAYFPGRNDLGYFAVFEGTLTIPPGLGHRNQIVVHFYFEAGEGQKGSAVQSLDAQYMDVYGNAACGTQPYSIPAAGLTTRWQCWMPYNALNVSMGHWVDTSQGRIYQEAINNLVAEAELFVDNFGVIRGQSLRFSLKR